MVDTTSSSSMRQRAEAPSPDSDEALLADFRAGQERAFAELYARHHRTAAGVARHVIGRGPAVDDVVAESFTSLLTAVRRGGGPSSNVRSYLLTTVRNTAIGFLRAQQKAVPAEAEVVDRPHHDRDELTAADDDHRVRRAFAEMPARWRRVLWYVDVHELPPAQVGPLLGVSPNAVSSLARRARQRLRREYLQAHQDRVAPGCEDFAPHLARYVDETLAVPVHHRVDAHVLECAFCAAAVDQMRDLKRRMRAVLLPLGLPVAAAGELDHDPDADDPDADAEDSGADDSGAEVSTPRPGPGRARALGRRWWWARPRIGARTFLLGAAAVALCLLMLFGITASGVVGEGTGQAPGHVAGGAPLPDDGGLLPDPGPAGDGGRPEWDDPADSDPVPGGGAAPSPSPWPGDHRDEPQGGPRYVDDRSGSWDAPGGGPAPVDPTPTPGSTTPGSQPGGTTPDPAAAPTPDPTSGPDPIPEPSRPTGPSPTLPSSPAPTPTRPPEPVVLEVAHDDLGDLVPGRTGVLGATVTNPNPDPTGAVVVDVTLPAGVELDTAGGARAVSAWACADAAGGGVVAGAPSVVSCAVDTVAAGDTSTLLVPVLVAADVAGGDVDLRLDVRGDGVAPASATVPVPVRAGSLAARYVATGSVQVSQAGAPVLHCDPAAAGCAAVANGTATGSAQNNNWWNMVSVDALGTGTNSSTAVLDIPAGSEVLGARVYWAGGCAGEIGPVRVAPPGGALTAVGEVTVDRSGAQMYQASADVTDLVRSGGAGTWGVADVCATEARGGFAGWALVVVHRPAGTGPGGSGLAIVYDGLQPVSSAVGSATFSVAGRPGTTARIGAVVWDGDRSAPGDQLLFDGAPMVPPRWNGVGPAGPGSGENAFDSTAWGSAYANALGVDVKPFAPATLTSTRAELTAVETNGDAFTVGVVTVATG
ncbi:sigma-70 family RNA polymerase sigma factor [Promicromonospora panici]|uniref:sigma-70 family RNA polymerase sigma factor n=1 Tax=Promicromonospora panici TaxID=2219658 RepID=UPI00101CB2D2|nr:sigma-70 family RNA polymerase sigma factor [Promicromonospora panici]